MSITLSALTSATWNGNDGDDGGDATQIRYDADGNVIMSRIIYCSDLILRIDDPEEEIHNVTEWLRDQTDFKPTYPEGCVLRQEVGAMGKLTVIFIVWLALVVLTTFYCYFCEQRLFPKQKFLEWGYLRKRRQASLRSSRSGSLSSSTSSYHLPASPSLSSVQEFANSDRNSGIAYHPDRQNVNSGLLKFKEFRRLNSSDSLNPGGMTQRRAGTNYLGLNNPGMNSPGLNTSGMNFQGLNNPGMNCPGLNNPGMSSPELKVRPPAYNQAQYVSFGR